MSTSWELLFLLFVPGLFGLVLLMNWLEVYFTYQLVADDVVTAWHSIDSAEDLEEKVERIVARVMSNTR
ncbi:MAG TPA: hypothetical protein VHE56_00275 [Mycobacteriales bacterium]|nr:hypothetical protein [Mycobacteriales bacterium]